MPHNTSRANSLLIALGVFTTLTASAASHEWPAYGGSPGGTRIPCRRAFCST